MANSVLVRMYNVGFGDCFLIEIPNTGDRPTRILIDCGSIAQGNLAMKKIVERIVEDIKDDDGVARISVVVCTHRHADHVSGFASESWRDVEVKEVWFPWTENPDDPAARTVRDAQSKLALALTSHWNAQVAAAVPNAAMWQELAANALSNEKAMTMLHEGIRSRPSMQFLSSDGSPTRISTNVLPGVRAFVLGPSKSPDVIRDMDPPSGKTYLRQGAGGDGSKSSFEPFEDDWPIEPENYSWMGLDNRDRDAIRTASTSWDPAITVALESAVNGTSLVLVFEVGDAVLFFPGDAQWGTWNALLNNAKSADLLERTSFWKVGHHGSHNATPMEFVAQRLPAACCAMMSTKTGKWKTIPRQPLIDAITGKGVELARSDAGQNVAYRKFTTWTADVIETRVAM